MDYDYFLSEVSKARQPSPIRALVPLVKTPGMISLGAGNPNPTSFPFKSMTVTLNDGQNYTIAEDDMADALQYGPTPGLPALREWLHNFQNTIHEPPAKSFDLCVGTGSQDLLAKTLEALISPGDYVLIENPTYTGTLAFLRSQPCNLVEVETDDQGLVPDSLYSILDNWDHTQRFPKILYTVPVGGNPTGISTTFERKQQIYAYAQKFNILILEDDPYYYLQFNSPRIKSYLSMDTDGRVVRFDSMSKLLSAGIRIGWATGPAPIIDRINMHTQATNLHPSSLAQMVIYKLLEQWGVDQFLKHADSVASLYKGKRDNFLACADKHLAGTCAQWVVPSAGMFVWIKLDGIDDTKDLIHNKALEKKVLAIPGEFTGWPVASEAARLYDDHFIKATS
ncbi:3337_t:CDS:2, partial [Paraglomus occultum]